MRIGRGPAAAGPRGALAPTWPWGGGGPRPAAGWWWGPAAPRGGAARASLQEQYPNLEDELLDELLPKKGKVTLGKCADKTSLVCADARPLFFQPRDGPLFPTLRLLHRYPDIMPKLRVDRGAIKFVLSGANIMCPGLTSPGAEIHDEVEEGEPVAIFAEGKEHALAVGVAVKSTAEIRSVNKDVGVELVHYLNDGLYKAAKL